jgi:hypothetical protein
VARLMIRPSATTRDSSSRSAVSDRVTARPAICQTVDLKRGARCPGDARRDRASPESESPRTHLNLAGAGEGFSLWYPDPEEYAAQRRQPHRSVDCEGPTIADLLRADTRNPGLPKVAIFGTSRDQLPSAEQLRPHPAPSFERIRLRSRYSKTISI